MAGSVGNEKASLAMYQRKSRELSTRLDIIASLEMEVKGLIDQEKKVDEQKSKVEEAKRSLEGLRKRLDEKGIESGGLDTRLGVSMRWFPADRQQLDRQLQNASDKLERQQEMGKTMHERANGRVESLKAQ
jgi:kinetochore protein Nuf2